MTKYKTAKVMKSIVKILLVLIILVGIVGLIVNIKDKTEVSTFSLSVNGDIISADKSGYVASVDNPLSVEVMFPSNVAVEDRVYSYGLQPAKDNDFKFYVDYRSYSFSQWQMDIDKCFEIVPTKNGFTITPKANSIQELLKVCYPSNEIHIDDSQINSNTDLFLLTVKPKNNNSIVVGFRFPLGVKTVTGIELDKREIVF